jgi:sulfite exporter TauE/SafE
MNKIWKRRFVFGYMAFGGAMSLFGIVEQIIWPHWMATVREGFLDMILGALLMMAGLLIFFLYFPEEATKLLKTRETTK